MNLNRKINYRELARRPWVLLSIFDQKQKQKQTNKQTNKQKTKNKNKLSNKQNKNKAKQKQNILFFLNHFYQALYHFGRCFCSFLMLNYLLENYHIS